jgi:hypothetical protein
VCVKWVEPFVWREAQPHAYKYVHLSLNLIEQPFSLPNSNIDQSYFYHKPFMKLLVYEQTLFLFHLLPDIKVSPFMPCFSNPNLTTVKCYYMNKHSHHILSA